MHWKATTSSLLILRFLSFNTKQKARSTADYIAQAETVANNSKCPKESVFSAGSPSTIEACFHWWTINWGTLRGKFGMSPFYTSVKSHDEEDWINCEQLDDVSFDRAQLRGGLAVWKKYLSADREATSQEAGDISNILVLPEFQASTGIGNRKLHRKLSPLGVVPEKLHKFRRWNREGLIDWWPNSLTFHSFRSLKTPDRACGEACSTVLRTKKIIVGHPLIKQALARIRRRGENA
jgi:hypothetical protein